MVVSASALAQFTAEVAVGEVSKDNSSGGLGTKMYETLADGEPHKNGEAVEVVREIRERER
ncbi:hypothetical protein AArcMg_0962 [Natrarchaeobaculum sulfurireducens]|uniref:Uncharacterized protein n=2 Tax=Natrarchaeobaculum sulfurireducens TaxID=2044521 RepID=A0A346PN85_9EURY|nr:hypothetical protein AArcMg_0962 [Natrarchaeobaculum sulfurireducens]